MTGENPIQIITGMQGQPQLKWTDICKDIIKKIEAMKPKDRLEYASCVSDLLFTIARTVKGWNQWYAIEFSKPFERNPLSEIPEDQFKQIFEFFKAVALNMLKFDITVTAVAEEKAEAEMKKQQTKKKKKSNKKKRVYVA